MSTEVDVAITGNTEVELEDEFQETGRFILEAVALAAYNRWLALAAERLTKSRGAYTRALRLPEIEGKEATITLGGTDSRDDLLANWVENGLPGADMRETHLKGAPRRVIRFELEGAGAGPSKNTSPTPVNPATEKNILRRMRGERLSPGAIPGKFSGAVHAGGPRYFTYRTISANSPAGTWMRPEIEARHLMDQVQDELPEIVAAAVADALENG